MNNYFKLSELLVTDTKLKNVPTAFDVVENLRELSCVLSVLRCLVGSPIKCNSGYRSDAVNSAVGGVPGSLHLLGRAADITSVDIVALRQYCSLFYYKGVFRECIDHDTYIHVAI